jgi:hypothetical protein
MVLRQLFKPSIFAEKLSEKSFKLYKYEMEDKRIERKEAQRTVLGTKFPANK